jgi:hypothetical protein
MCGPEPEQRLEGRHWGAAAVVAEDELVEVDLQVLLGGAAVGALQPGLEVGEGAVQNEAALLAAPALGDWPVVEAEVAKSGVAAPVVGMDDRAGLDAPGHPRSEAALAGIWESRKPKTPRASAADLHGDPDKPLSNGVSAGLAVGIDAADETLVDLHFAAQGLALGGDHHPAQLLQDEPGGLIAREAELALQLLGGDARGGGWRPGRPPRTRDEAGCGCRA